MRATVHKKHRPEQKSGRLSAHDLVKSLIRATEMRGSSESNRLLGRNAPRRALGFKRGNTWRAICSRTRGMNYPNRRIRSVYRLRQIC